MIKIDSELGAKISRLILLFLLLSLFFPPIKLQAVDVIEEWVARYNGPGNYDDYAEAMVVDDSGNVYITGHSHGSGSHRDYATTKYDSDGNEQWVARYNGPGNYHDTPTAIAVDALDNVYVTGYSYGDGTSSDYATIKYNSYGIQQWVARYNGPGNGNDLVFAMAADDIGNVYITGESYDRESRLDYTTIKYDGNGRRLWVATYNGPGNYNDSAKAIALDAFGNVYVTGYSYSGGETREDYVTVKYSSSGRQLWVARYAGPSGSPYSAYDVANAIAVDTLGNVYVTGYSDGSATSYDYATIKYDSDGIEQWEARYNGSGDNYDYAHAIVLDSSDCVYVTGYSDNLWTRQDYATVKYDSDGLQLWVATYNSPANSNDRACSILVDPSDNVYVTGYSYEWGTSLDYATIKYDFIGNEVWVATYDGPSYSGNVVSDASDDNSSIPTVNGPDNDCDYAYAMALDRSGNIYVTGGSFGAESRYDFATIKYSQEDTPPGKKVEVADLKTGSMLTFDAVEGGGNTTVKMTPVGSISPKEMLLVPSGMVYEMHTTAVYSGMIQLAIMYDDTGLNQTQENDLKLKCYESSTDEWEDITVALDIENNIIYAQSGHLSFFAVTVAP
ncbi:MAG: SBBP repeat-containing protein [Sedimentisphaerales bacterium]|nr:SBBP repeat-containing protein [Sedimentisphaerales bacterium]